MEKVGAALFVVGAVLAGVALVKFFAIGFYQDEIVPFALIGALGLALCWSGSKIFTASRNRQV